MSTQEARASAPRAKRTRKKANPSGITPLEFNVLIRQKKVEEKIGNIYRPVELLDKEQAAAIEGEIIAVSRFAFTYDDWGRAPKPKAGQKCIFAKYTGLKVPGRDGEDYLLVKDKDIAALIG